MIIENEAAARIFCGQLTDSSGLARLERFAALLLAENRRQNLVARASEDSLWVRHFADSAQLLALGVDESVPWLDLGTGAGLPGLVVAAMRPDIHCVLVESRKRRAEWLAQAASELGLANCRVEGLRLENVQTFAAGTVSARAFAPLAKLLNLSARFSTQGTLWLLPKGRSAGQELADLPESVRRMFHVEQSVTDAQAGIVVGRGKLEFQ